MMKRTFHSVPGFKYRHQSIKKTMPMLEELSKMATNKLLAKLRANSKKGQFQNSTGSISYPTGFPTFDYRNGYLVTVRDASDQIVDRYPAIGIQEGTVTTVVANPQAGKTTALIQWCTNIIKPFENGFVHHIDLEKAMTLTRIRELTGFTRDEFENKYVFDQACSYLDDVLAAIVAIYKEKIENSAEYMYDTGKLDDYGQKIITYQPTCVIIDSLMELMEKDHAMEMEGLTAGGRNAIRYAQFFAKITPLCKAANIMVFVVNHLKDVPQTNAFSYKKPLLPFMPPNKNIPGGVATLLLSHNVFFFDVIKKFNADEDGFAGQNVRLALWKSRTNFAGQTCLLTFNQQRGFDPIMGLFFYLYDKEKTEGRNPSKWISGYKDVPEARFDERIIYKEVMSKPALRKAIITAGLQELKAVLSTIHREDVDKMNDQTDYTSIYNAAGESNVAALIQEEMQNAIEAGVDVGEI